MANTEFRVSTLIDNQVPDFVQADHPVFVQFLKAYYEWLENSEEGATIYESRKLLDYADVDRTTDEFITYFKTKFLPYFPEDVLADKAKLIKNIRSFYQEKGSEESLKLLFRVLYKEEIDIFYPKEQILIASDGKWKQPQALRLTVANTANNFDVSTLRGRRGEGSTSKASCIIEGAYRTIDRDFGFEIFEVYVSSVNRLFENGEDFVVSYRDETGNTVTLISETIIGSLASITIDPNNRGLKYKIGDPVVVFGGLSQISDSVRNATAFVSNVTSGGINTIDEVRGGYGFRQFPDSEVFITNDPSDNTGSGAAAQVTAIDTANAVSLYVNTDVIANLSNVALDNTTYQLANLASANINTALELALSTDLINVAPIQTITLTAPGTNYQAEPILDVVSFYDTANNGRQDLLSLGLIAAVEVISGGTGYDANTDTISISTIGNGSNAEFSFTTNATGHITSVTVVNMGEGYRDTTVTINSANGTGAVLTAYRYGEGEENNLTVDEIGRVRAIALSNKGAGYVSTPIVSLRVKEITVANVSGVVLNGDFVYQGADENNITFSATVDSYDTANNRLRVFNYLGTLDTELPLKFPSFESTVVSSFNYGNGLARATAKFLNGLINYQGFYLNTDGFVSSDMRLQDDRKYHNFSYVVIAERALSDYREALLDILHPTGTSLLGYNRLISEVGKFEAISSNVVAINTATVGTVTSNSFWANATITGIGTTFSDLSEGDLIVINSGVPDRKFVREIVSITSNTELTAESNTSFIGDGRLTLAASNVNVTVSGNTYPLNVIAGDVIRYSQNGNTVNAIVVSANGVVIETNVASATANTNVVYQVFPTLVNVSYTAIST